MRRSIGGGLALVALVGLLLPPVGAGAHEFWIEPTVFRVGIDGTIVADLKLGKDLKGNTHPYVPAEAVRVAITDGAVTRRPLSRTGDIPAFHEAPARKGLHVLSYHSKERRVTYDDPALFQGFLAREGLDWARAAHRRRGLPPDGFTEVYTRCAKALVQVGEGAAGADKPLGMPLELIAEVNPYALRADASALPVRLRWNGAPIADIQISVFRHDRDDALTVAKVRTDAAGRATIPLGDGGMVLLNAVHMIPWGEKPGDAWHSYWATLSFTVPFSGGADATRRDRPTRPRA